MLAELLSKYRSSWQPERRSNGGHQLAMTLIIAVEVGTGYVLTTGLQ